LGYRDRDKIIFDILREIFKTKDIRTIKQNVLNLNEDPNNIILWLNENLFNEYKKIEDINRAYNYLSQSDIFLSRTFKKQYFGFWSYAIDLMCGGVANSKTISYNNKNYHFPIWLKKLKYENKNIFLMNSILNKISKMLHISNYKTKLYIFDYFKILFKNNKDFSKNMSNFLNLTDEEIIYLSDKKYEKQINEISDSKVKIIKKSIDKGKKTKENNKEIRLQYSLNDF
jgi:replication factor C large subunit